MSKDMLVYDEMGNITDEDINRVSKLIDRANIKQHRSIIFWRLVGCRLFGHKANSARTHITVAPGIYCARCFSWVVKH